MCSATQVPLIRIVLCKIKMLQNRQYDSVAGWLGIEGLHYNTIQGLRRCRSKSRTMVTTKLSQNKAPWNNSALVEDVVGVVVAETVVGGEPHLNKE